MKKPWILLLMVVLLSVACGNMPGNHGGTSDSNDSGEGSSGGGSSSPSPAEPDSSASQELPGTSDGTGDVPVDSCSGSAGSCVTNADQRIYTREELPRSLWCWYGYSGADAYCQVKINESAFQKK